MLRDLAVGLDRGDFKVRAACLGPSGPVVEELLQKGVKTHCLAAAGPWDIRIFYRLAKLIGRFRPHIIHSFLAHANVAARLTASAIGTANVVASIHTAERQKRWHLIAETLTCRLSRITVCVSPSVGRYTALKSHVPPGRLAVIQNGIDCELYERAQSIDKTFLGLDPAKKTIVFVGRLDSVKGLDLLINAMSQLVDQNVQLLIVGDGPELNRLKKLTARLRFESIVKFAGHQSNIPGILTACDIFAMPSRWEGLGIAAIEAMAAGLPVVASRTYGLVDVVKHNVTGLLVETGDLDAFADGLRNMLNDPQKAKRLGTAGKERARSIFRVDQMVRSYEKLYLSI